MKRFSEASKLTGVGACLAAAAVASTGSAALAAAPPKTQPKLPIAFGVPPETFACSLLKKDAIGGLVGDSGGNYPCTSRSGASVSLSLGGLTSYVPTLPSTGGSQIFTATAGPAIQTSGDPRGYFLMKIVLYSSPAIVTGIEQNVSGVAAENGWKKTSSSNYDAGYVMPSRTSKAFPLLPNDKRQVTVSGFVFAKGSYVVFLVTRSKAGEVAPPANLKAEGNLIAAEL